MLDATSSANTNNQPTSHADTARFRAALEALLAEHLSDDVHRRVGANHTLHDMQLHKVFAEHDLIGLGWPSEAGGHGRGPEIQAEFWETVHYFGAPVDAQLLTESVGTVLLRYATRELQREILPRIVAGTTLISLGYTEANAGSDLSSVATTALRDGDVWRINGSKMFTTMAHIADYIFLIARTTPRADNPRGVTLFLVPTDQAGFSVTAVETFGGERTNATFYTDVIVPDRFRIGEPDNGWPVLLYSLDVERAYVGSYVGQARRLMDDLVVAVRGRAVDPSMLALLPSFAARLESAAELTQIVYGLLAAGEQTGAAAATAKLAATEVFKDLAHFAMDVVGPESLLCPPGKYRPLGGSFEHAFRHSQVGTVYGGSSEMQRNLIASEALNLPRRQEVTR